MVFPTRNKGGYILLYVVLVIIVLCILATGICTAALNNLKAQESSMKRMEQEYQAEGNIEYFVSELYEQTVAHDAGGTGGAGKGYFELQHTIAAIADEVNDYAVEVSTAAAFTLVASAESSLADDQEGEFEAEFDIDLISRFEDVIVEASMDVIITMEVKQNSENETQFYYALKELTYEYTNYEIGTYVPPDSPEGGES